jgi:hypothetical protein
MKAIWSQLGITNDEAVRDLWAHQDMGTHMTSYSATVEPGGVVMIIASPLTLNTALKETPSKTLLFTLPVQMPAADMTSTGFRGWTVRRQRHAASVTSQEQSATGARAKPPWYHTETS